MSIIDARVVKDVDGISISTKLGNLSKVPNEYEWTATAGQLTYVMPSPYSYDINSKWLQVSVGGGVIPDSLIRKDSSTQFTILTDPSLIPAGVTVMARMVQPFSPATTIHHQTHELGGTDELDVTTLKNYQEQIADKINAITPITIHEEDSFTITVENFYDATTPTEYWLTTITPKDDTALKTLLKKDFAYTVGGSFDPTAKETPIAHANRVKAAFATNASGWDADSPSYVGTQKIDGIQIMNGVVYQSTPVVHPTDWYTLGVDNNGLLQCFVNTTSTDTMLQQGIVNTWAFSIPIIQNGAEVSSSIYNLYGGSTLTTARTIIGQVNNTNEIIIMTVDYKTSRSIGMTLSQCAAVLLSRNCRIAYCLDGGGSAQAIYKGQPLNHPSDGLPRPTADLLYVSKYSHYNEYLDVQKQVVDAIGGFDDLKSMIMSTQVFKSINDDGTIDYTNNTPIDYNYILGTKVIRHYTDDAHAPNDNNAPFPGSVDLFLWNVQSSLYSAFQLAFDRKTARFAYRFNNLGTWYAWNYQNKTDAVNIVELGAKANGTDQAATIQTILTNNRSIYVPNGVFKINSALDVPPNTEITFAEGAVFDMTALSSGNGFTTRVGSSFKNVHLRYSNAFSGTGWYFTTVDNGSSTSVSNTDTNIYNVKDINIEKVMPASGIAWDWYTGAAGTAFVLDGVDNPDVTITSGFWGGFLENIIVKGVWLQAGLIQDDGTAWITSSTINRVTIDGARRGIQINGTRSGNLTVTDVHMQGWRWTKTSQPDVVTEWMLKVDNAKYCHFRDFQPQDFSSTYNIQNFIQFGSGATKCSFESMYVLADTDIQDAGVNTRLVTPLGIKFPNLLSSADKKTLDWYEEGSFTPIALGGTTSGTATYGTQNGVFTRIGNVVRFSLEVSWSNHTGTGNLRIGGLPYTSNANDVSSALSLYASTLSYGSGQVSALLGKGTKNIDLYLMSNDATSINVQVDAAVGMLRITGTYTV